MAAPIVRTLRGVLRFHMVRPFQSQASGKAASQSGGSKTLVSFPVKFTTGSEDSVKGEDKVHTVPALAPSVPAKPGEQSVGLGLVKDLETEGSDMAVQARDEMPSQEIKSVSKGSGQEEPTSSSSSSSSDSDSEDSDDEKSDPENVKPSKPKSKSQVTVGEGAFNGTSSQSVPGASQPEGELQVSYPDIPWKGNPPPIAVTQIITPALSQAAPPPARSQAAAPPARSKAAAPPARSQAAAPPARSQAAAPPARSQAAAPPARSQAAAPPARSQAAAPPARSQAAAPPARSQAAAPPARSQAAAPPARSQAAAPPARSQAAVPPARSQAAAPPARSQAAAPPARSQAAAPPARSQAAAPPARSQAAAPPARSQAAAPPARSQAAAPPARSQAAAPPARSQAAAPPARSQAAAPPARSQAAAPPARCQAAAPPARSQAAAPPARSQVVLASSPPNAQCESPADNLLSFKEECYEEQSGLSGGSEQLSGGHSGSVEAEEFEESSGHVDQVCPETAPGQESKTSPPDVPVIDLPFDNSHYQNLQHHAYTSFTFVDYDVELASFRLPQPSSGRLSPQH